MSSAFWRVFSERGKGGRCPKKWPQLCGVQAGRGRVADMHWQRGGGGVASPLGGFVVLFLEPLGRPMVFLAGVWAVGPSDQLVAQPSSSPPPPSPPSAKSPPSSSSSISPPNRSLTLKSPYGSVASPLGARSERPPRLERRSGARSASGGEGFVRSASTPKSMRASDSGVIDIVAERKRGERRRTSADTNECMGRCSLPVQVLPFD
mmetsp:Transcript_26142/g.73209  ORF Transcript_26142/g.73209 Transcript_26142/m.73209 type:complete len:206 (-) Transcript_26142:42-659(-)